MEKQAIRVRQYELKTGISLTPEFEKKGLATHAVNVGTKCGHGCLYCSTGAVLRMHRSFRDSGEDPFSSGYARLCPLLPGIADSQEDIERLVKLAVDCRAEEIFVEPMNPGGPGLKLCQEALEQNGYHAEADAIGRIRQRVNWSNYVAELVSRVQQAVQKHSNISKLRFLLYPSGLLPQDKAKIQKDDAGVVWLG